jgi:hypothetical protein
MQTPKSPGNSPAGPDHEPTAPQQSHTDDVDPPLAEWMATSNDFLLIRSFRTLNVQVIQTKQRILARKEGQLRRMDTMLNEGRTRGCGFLKDDGTRREELLLEIGLLSKDYSASLVSSLNLILADDV